MRALPRSEGSRIGPSSSRRVERDFRLVQQLFAADGTDTMREFEGLLREMQIGRKVHIRKFEAGDETFALVLIDNVQFASLSDGTQRLAEILWVLVAYPDSLLAIEEPETAVHPALLARLLNVMHTYSSDRQIVLSTHSPFLVNHVEPIELRLVERDRRTTRVRSLDPKETTNVDAYLCDEGTLGEYLYEFLSPAQEEDDGDEDRNTG